MSNKVKNERPNKAKDRKLRTAKEIEEILYSTLSEFPSPVITQIAMFSEFEKQTCSRCKEIVWQEFAKEIGVFTIWRTGYYPPEFHACARCRELRFEW